MRLLNTDKSDFSEDSYVVMAALLWSLSACERMGSRMADAFDGLLGRNTFFQKKKYHMKEALRCCKAMLYHLEECTSETFDRMYEKASKEKNTRTLSIVAQDMIDASACLMLMYAGKADGSSDAATSMLKAISNFKTANPNIHMDELLAYFHFNGLIR